MRERATCASEPLCGPEGMSQEAQRSVVILDVDRQGFNWSALPYVVFEKRRLRWDDPNLGSASAETIVIMLLRYQTLLSIRNFA